MQKYVDLKELGNKIHIISAFAIDHVKGYIYVEADRQSDVIEVTDFFMDVSTQKCI